MNKINITIVVMLWIMLGAILLIFTLDIRKETIHIEELTTRVEQLEEQNNILETALAEVDWDSIITQYLNEHITDEHLLALIINVLEYHDFYGTLDREIQQYIQEYFEDLLLKIVEEIQPTP